MRCLLVVMALLALGACAADDQATRPQLGIGATPTTVESPEPALHSAGAPSVESSLPAQPQAAAQPARLPESKEDAEIRYLENLEVCLDGRWSAFCDHTMLTAYDAAQVDEAEYSANLAACLDAKLRSFCRPDLLRGLDVDRARAAGALTAPETTPGEDHL